LIPEFPESRENNREFAKFPAFSAIPASIRAAIPVCCTQIPYSPEQGILLAGSEFIRRNREFHNNIVKINIVKTQIEKVSLATAVGVYVVLLLA